MIVLQESLITAPPAGFSAHLPIIGWQSHVTTSNIAATSADTDYPATNLANPATNLKWLSVSTSTQYLTLSPSGTDEYDYVGVARHNWGSAGVTVSIEADTGSGYAEIVAGVIPADDKPLLFRFDAITPTGLRIKLVPDGTEPEAAVAYMGLLLTLEQGVQAGHTPLPYGRQRDIVTGRSESGEYLGRIESGASLKARAEIKNLTAAHYREDVDPFLADGGPFFFAWAPQAYPDEVGYAWNTNDPVPTPQLSGLVDLSFDLEGLAL